MMGKEEILIYEFILKFIWKAKYSYYPTEYRR
jgi:hypothetical protein